MLEQCVRHYGKHTYHSSHDPSYLFRSTWLTREYDINNYIPAMPKDTRPARKKATDKPAPLYDSSTRGYVSTRTSTVIATASNITSREYTTHSQVISGLPRPLFGNFNEALYARPPFLEEHNSPDNMMEVDNGDVLQSGLPGIVITKKVRSSKQYVNSVRLSVSHQ